MFEKSGLDPNTGKEPMITLSEHRQRLSEALTSAGHAPAGHQRLVIDVGVGSAKVVSVETVG